MAHAFTADQICAILAEHHPAPEWATFRELSDGTGSKKSVQIDLFAFNLWKSGGYRRLAFEVKVSRADFRRELDKPAKRAPWQGLAEETWFAAPAGVIPVGEVPEGWGLLEVLPDGSVKRPRRAVQRSVTALPIDFAAALARRVSDPPPPPSMAWELLGRPVRLADLLRLAEKAHGRKPALPPDWMRRTDTPSQQRALDEQRRLGALAYAVARVCGRDVRTAERFEEWAKKGARMELDVRPELRAALQSIEAAIEKVGK